MEPAHATLHKYYMGRVFLTPEKFTPAEGAQFWINFGFFFKGTQSFPSWLPGMEGTVSKEDYDALMQVRGTLGELQGLALVVDVHTLQQHSPSPSSPLGRTSRISVMTRALVNGINSWRPNLRVVPATPSTATNASLRRG